MRVLGIDPGFGLCGFAVISETKGKCSLGSYGVIKTDKKDPFPERILEIGTDIQKLLKKHKPDIVSVEDLFFVQNISTGIRVAQVRGLILFLAQQSGATILEPKPTELKLAFTGNGKATKQDIKKMAQILFSLETSPRIDDASDAIAAAYFGLLSSRLLSKDISRKK